MDTNLLVDLRKCAKDLGDGPRGIGWGYAVIMTEAADEIERLRKEVADLKHDIERHVAIAASELN